MSNTETIKISLDNDGTYYLYKMSGQIVIAELCLGHEAPGPELHQAEAQGFDFGDVDLVDLSERADLLSRGESSVPFEFSCSEQSEDTTRKNDMSNTETIKKSIITARALIRADRARFPAGFMSCDAAIDVLAEIIAADIKES